MADRTVTAKSNEITGGDVIHYDASWREVESVCFGHTVPNDGPKLPSQHQRPDDCLQVMVFKMVGSSVLVVLPLNRDVQLRLPSR